MTGLTTLEKVYPEIPAAVLFKEDPAFSGLSANAALMEAGRTSCPHYRPVQFQTTLES